MSTDMRGIQQISLFSLTAGITVNVCADSQYRLLAQVFPWLEAAEIVNRYRALKVDIDNGRILDLRAHIGALLAQTMNGKSACDPDRLTSLNQRVGVNLLSEIAQPYR